MSVSTMTAGEHFLQEFVNYEAKGVPDKAGTDTEDGFDLVKLYITSSADISMYGKVLALSHMLRNEPSTSTSGTFWHCRAA